MNDRSTNGDDRSGVDRRQLLKTTAGGALGISLAGCTDALGSRNVFGATDDAADEPVKIGVLAPDPESDPTGISMARGATLAVQELNANGGILGSDVELIVRDTNSSPAEARRQYQELTLEEDVDLTTGIFSSEALGHIMDDIARQRTLHLTTGASTMEASRKVNEEYDEYKYHFRVGPYNEYQLAELQIEFAEEMAPELGWESVAVLVEDYKWTEPAWEITGDRLREAGIDVAVENRYPAATDDFGTIYDEVEAENADAALVAMAHTGTDAILDWAGRRQFAFAGVHVPMQLPSYYDLVRGACRFGITVVSAAENTPVTEKTVPFANAYKNAFDGASPMTHAYTTYDAVKLFAAAAEDAETVDSTDLVPVLEEFSHVGTTTEIEFYGPDDRFAHDLVADKGDALYTQWQENDDGDGVQEVIWPENHATADYVAPPWL